MPADRYLPEPIVRLQAWLHAELDPSRRKVGLSPVNFVLLCLILVAVSLACLETEDKLQRAWQGLFQSAENALGVIFLAEYCARLWVSPLGSPKEKPWKARLSFVLSLASILDLLSVLGSFLTPTGLTPFSLRLLRLLRIIRLAKLARLSRAASYFTHAIAARRDELFFSLLVGLVFLVGTATLLYLVEGPVQPDKFGSIPRALWWAVATLTTIGYGDVYPVTPLGKFCAAVSAVVGIGLVAVPTGIMAAAFTDAQRQQETERRSDELARSLSEDGSIT